MALLDKMPATPAVRVLEEMFPRTALAVVDEGRPFTDTVTSNRFVVTPVLLALMGYIDTTPRNDQGTSQASGFWVTDDDPSFAISIVPSPAIPLTDTLNAASPNYLKSYETLSNSNYCPNPSVQPGRTSLHQIFGFLFGTRGGCKTGIRTVFTADDWNAWRSVTIRVPNAGETPTDFWDLDALRGASEFLMLTPRAGFMTTPAFLTNWATNTSNQARVTTNQTMIVALGKAFDDRGVTVQLSADAGDAEHAQPGTTCYACHQTLDPMRDFFRRTYTYEFGRRESDKNNDTVPATATFTVDGSAPVAGNGIGDLAAAVATTHVSPSPGRRNSAASPTRGRATRATPSFNASPRRLPIAISISRRSYGR